jgi:hypothetical protein
VEGLKRLEFLLPLLPAVLSAPAISEEQLKMGSNEESIADFTQKSIVERFCLRVVCAISEKAGPFNWREKFDFEELNA